MFESSMMESAVALGPKNRWPAVISTGLQVLLATAVVLVPLLHPATLSMLPKLATLEMPPLPKPPVPPVEMQRVRVTPAATSTTVVPAVEALHQPLTRRTASESLSDLPPQVNPALAFGSISGSKGAMSAIMHGMPLGTHVVGVSGSPASDGNASAAHATISRGVSAGLLLEPIRPLYPAIAKAAGQSGTVRVLATISTTGRVENAHAVSGPMMLQSAAVDAVRMARYRPYMLNGKPTEVDASFEINFRLNE